jgi:hypothetical protein
MNDLTTPILRDGEVWVAPGIGSRFIDYLKRTYGGKATPTQRRRIDPLTGAVRNMGVRPEHRERTCECGTIYKGKSLHCSRCNSLRLWQNGAIYLTCPICKGYKDRKARLCKACREAEKHV